MALSTSSNFAKPDDAFRADASPRSDMSVMPHLGAGAQLNRILDDGQFVNKCSAQRA